MSKFTEKCKITGKDITSARQLLDMGLAVSTYGMQIARDCHERPKENGGPASLPECRNFCPFYTLVKA